MLTNPQNHPALSFAGEVNSQYSTSETSLCIHTSLEGVEFGAPKDIPEDLKTHLITTSGYGNENRTNKKKTSDSWIQHLTPGFKI